MTDPSLDSPISQDRDHLETLESCDLVALLRLNNASPTAAAHGGDRPLYTTCASNSKKRRSPSPSPYSRFSGRDLGMGFDPEASSPQGHFVEQVPCNLGGFSKISLPTSIGTQIGHQSCPVLRRSVSDLTQTNPPPAGPSSNLQMGIGPETPSPKKGTSLASALPPLPPILRRTVSDLSTSQTPPKVSSCLHRPELVEEESSDSMRLRRMKDRLVEMGQWCNEVVREEERVNARSEDGNNNMTENVSEADPEESVSVERVGEGITIQFKCPCGKGYQILISGNSCYYKLM